MCKFKRARCPTVASSSTVPRALQAHQVPSAGRACRPPEARAHGTASLRAPAFSLQPPRWGFHLPSPHTHTLTDTRSRPAARGPSPSCLPASSFPDSLLLGKQKHICQPKNHHEFVFSTGGFRRRQGWPPPGMTALPALGGRARARGSSSRAWCPTPRGRLRA